MPTRTDTKAGPTRLINNHILPKWGGCVVTDLERGPVELWLESLPLAQESKTHVRDVLRNLWTSLHGAVTLQGTSATRWSW